MGGVVRPLCEPQRGQALFEGVKLEALDGQTSTQNAMEAPQICDPRRADSKNRHPGTPPDPSCLWNTHQISSPPDLPVPCCTSGIYLSTLAKFMLSLIQRCRADGTLIVHPLHSGTGPSNFLLGALELEF